MIVISERILACVVFLLGLEVREGVVVAQMVEILLLYQMNKFIDQSM